MIDFPALHYSIPISEIFSKVRFVNIPEEIAKGLKNEISFVDLDGGLTDAASIDDTGKVEISATYCQILWFICYVAIYLHDYIALSKELSSYNDEKQKQFLNELEYCPELKMHVIDLFKIQDPLERLVPLTQTIQKLSKGEALSPEDIDYISSFNSVSSLSLKTGAAYCYAVVFDLLHEFSHHSLNHDFASEGSIEEEIDADNNAFLTMVCDFNQEEDFSSRIGIISALSSLLFLNPDLKTDHVHPYSDDRLFGYFDQLDLNEKGKKYLTIVLTLWSICFDIKDFPKTDERVSVDVTLQKMRTYLNGMKK